MKRPPVLSADERNAALEKARSSRSRRSEVKSFVRSGKYSIDDVLTLASNDDAVAKMRVVELLESFTGVGKVRAIATLDRLGISRTRRLQGLGIHQREGLIKEFSIPQVSLDQGALIVLSGPGGVGKSTVSKEIRKRNDFWVSVSATTRAPRENEVHGVDYIFMSDEEFDRGISNGFFLEWAAFAGARYGTPRQQVLDAIHDGKDVLLEIEINGAKQVKASWSDSILVFLEPPTWEDLISRLEGRATDSPERRAERLALAQDEMAQAPFFDHILVNDEVEKVVASLIRLVHSQRS
jgi:guanylate kinase